MQVQEIMTRHPACCTPDTKLADVARLMVQHDCGAIPVVESIFTLKLVGIVTDRDIVVRVLADGLNPLEKEARDCMSRPAITVTPCASLEECCKIMAQHRIRRVPVVDEHGTMCGIVSQADIAENCCGDSVREMLREVSKPTPVRCLERVG